MCIAMLVSLALPVAISLTDTLKANAEQESSCTHIHNTDCEPLPSGHICGEAAGCLPIYPDKTVIIEHGHRHSDACFLVTGGHTHNAECYTEENEQICVHDESAGISVLICPDAETDDITVTEPDTEAAPSHWVCNVSTLVCEHASCSSGAPCNADTKSAMNETEESDASIEETEFVWGLEEFESTVIPDWERLRMAIGVPLAAQSQTFTGPKAVIHPAGTNDGDDWIEEGVYNLVISDSDMTAGINRTGTPIEITGAITLEAGSGSINLNVNGETTGGSRHFTVTSSGNLTLGGSGGTLIIDGNCNSSSSSHGGGILVDSGGSLMLRNGVEIRNNNASQGGGILISNGGNFNMTGGVINHNTSSAGAGVFVQNSSFTMTGGLIDSNTGSDGGIGGGVYSTGSTLNISGTAKISNNTTGHGAGVSINDGTFTMNGGIISGDSTNNDSKGNGGGVSINNEGLFVLKSGVIDENTGKIGGGISVIGTGEFKMEGGTISRNTSEDGAGVYTETNFTMSGGTINNNNGSGVLVQSGHFIMENGTIKENTASVGGGVNVISGGIFDMKGGTIQENVAGWEGGGVRISGANTEFNMLSSVAVVNNNRSRDGGGVFVGNGSSYVLEAGTVSGNMASGANTNGGGGVLIGVGSSFTMNGGNINGNKAPTTGTALNERGNGGGVRVGINAEFTMSRGTISGNEAGENGGGVHVAGGTFDMYGGTIGGSSQADGNISRNGAGVYASSSDSFTMYNGMISSNGTESNTISGGGVALNGHFRMINGTIKNNRVGNSGGGVYATSFTMENGVISGNCAFGTSTGNGAGAYVNGGTFTMNSGVIGGSTSADKNHSRRDGGGVYIANQGSMTVNNGTISGNRADRNGGGIYITSYSNVIVSPHAAFSGNEAGRGPFWLEDCAETAIYSISGGTPVTVSALKALHDGQKLPEYPVQSKSSPQNSGMSIIGRLAEFGYIANNQDLNFDANGLTLIGCTVTFVDWNNSVLKTETVIKGGSATAPANPSRTGWTFTGWDRDFTNVMSDLVITALYTAVAPPEEPPVTPPVTPPTEPPVTLPVTPPTEPPVTLPATPPTEPPVTPPTTPQLPAPKSPAPVQPPSPPVSTTPLLPMRTPEPNSRFEMQEDGSYDRKNENTLKQIMEADNPPVAVEYQEIPLFAGNELSYFVWALWNLLLSVAGVVLAIMTVINVLMKLRTDCRNNENAEVNRKNKEEERKTNTGRRLLILAVPLLAIIALTLFLLTQDMKKLMVLVDRWTIVHAVLFGAAMVCYIFAFNRNDDEDFSSPNSLPQENRSDRMNRKGASCHGYRNIKTKGPHTKL